MFYVSYGVIYYSASMTDVIIVYVTWNFDTINSSQTWPTDSTHVVQSKSKRSDFAKRPYITVIYSRNTLTCSVYQQLTAQQVDPYIQMTIFLFIIFG